MTVEATIRRDNRKRSSNVFIPIPIAMVLRWCDVRVLTLLLLLACPALLRATVLDPPDLRCVSVMPGGAAMLNWVPPPDPAGEFMQYEVYRSNSPAGPFALVAALPVYFPATYTDAAAGADAGPRYYYLTTVSSSTPPNTSIPSDTIASIFIQVTQSVPLGSAVVDWNFPHTPPIGTAVNAQIEMEHPAGTWTLVDSVANTVHHWQQVVSVCQDSLNFRVRQSDLLGCVSYSSITGATFQDITPPSIPGMVEVTVDTATNQTTVNWNPSPELDTQGYIIVMSTPGGNVILDTLYGRLNTTYIWASSDAGTGPESYTIAAIDTCFRGTPPSPNTSATHAPHTTVHLTTTYDRCAGTIQVHRTDYGGWPVDHYELYAQLDHAGPVNLLATMAPGTTDFQQPNTATGHEYCFVVKAVGLQAGQESLSNKACRTTAFPAVPQWNYLRTATVAGEGSVLITDSMDMNAFTRRLVLERTSNGDPWEELASVAGAPGPVVTFNDAEALTAERSYNYRVLVEDSCGNTVVASNKGTSILLTVTPDPGDRNTLRWNGYVQWAGTVLGHTVYRSVADGPFLPIATTGADQWSFVDNVEDLYLSPGKFCYYVRAEETGNPAGINASSVSNTVCAIQQEEVWVPNAFIEGGHNNTFKPVLAFADIARYEFTIFNRWGQQIWTTTDPYLAWDGRVDGNTVPQGVYAWYCSFRNGAGKTVEKRGTVTFLAGR